nr:hypothetical protein GCM10025699_35600 [Microbacterium flavescens]
MLELEFLRGKVPFDDAPEVGGEPAVFGNADNGLISIDRLIQALLDVEIEPSLHPLTTRRDRMDDFVAHQDLIHRREPLLSVEQKRLGLVLTGVDGSTLKHARLELDCATGLECHHRADGEAARHRGDEAPNALLVPHPASLKVRQLEAAIVTRLEKGEETD